VGIFSAIAIDIEELVLNGYNDEYISKSVGVELILIQPIVSYFRNKHNIKFDRNKKNELCLR